VDCHVVLTLRSYCKRHQLSVSNLFLNVNSLMHTCYERSDGATPLARAAGALFCKEVGATCGRLYLRSTHEERLKDIP
jgi:hypothetical protein